MTNKKIILLSFLFLLCLTGENITINHQNTEYGTTINTKTVRQKIGSILANITINGNTQFNSLASSEGWSGYGNSTQPYIINGYSFTMAGTSGVNITNTDRYFILSNITVTGAINSPGIFLSNVTHGTLENNTLYGNNYGLQLVNSNNNNVQNNVIYNNLVNGLSLVTSNYNTVLNNTIYGNSQKGMELWAGSFYNMVMNNTIHNNADGLLLLDSQYNLAKWNTLYANAVGLYLLGGAQHSNNNIFEMNNVSFNGYGFVLDSSTNNTIITNTIFKNDNQGIYLIQTDTNNIIRNNIISENGYHGIRIDTNSFNNSILSNSLSNNVYIGILIVTRSNSNIVWNNSLNGNPQGVYIDESSYNNTISRNIITNSTSEGIYLESNTTNTISYNLLAGNSYGLTAVSTSKQNSITRNDFISNTHQASDSGSSNVFAYNYWNDWINMSYDSDGDGFLENAYPINGSVTHFDSYPSSHPNTDNSVAILQTFPGVPENLTISSGTGYILLQWNKPTFNGNKPILKYNIYRGTTPGVFDTILTALSTSYTDLAIKPGTTYYYAITAVNVIGESQQTTEVNLTTLTQPTAPTAPLSPQTSAGAGFVYLHWNTPSNNGGSTISKYVIYRGTSSGNYNIEFFSSTTNLNDSLVVGNITYYYVIRAVNGAGESSYSVEVSSTPLMSIKQNTIITITDTVTGANSSSTSTKGTPGFTLLGLTIGLGLLLVTRKRYKK